MLRILMAVIVLCGIGVAVSAQPPVERPSGTKNPHIETLGAPKYERCFVSGHGAMLSSDIVEISGVKYNAQRFDRNGDGKQDLVMLYAYAGTGGLLKPYPIVYMIDVDFDGRQDKEYQDVRGTGLCDDIIEQEPGSFRQRLS